MQRWGFDQQLVPSHVLIGRYMHLAQSCMFDCSFQCRALRRILNDLSFRHSDPKNREGRDYPIENVAKSLAHAVDSHGCLVTSLFDQGRLDIPTLHQYGYIPAVLVGSDVCRITGLIPPYGACLVGREKGAHQVRTFPCSLFFQRRPDLGRQVNRHCLPCR